MAQAGHPDRGRWLLVRRAVFVMPPLAIDLFCGLGGWTDGLLAEGWDVIGFDIERHVYGAHRYPAQLVLQDVLTLHGSQFRDAALIVASPPCQAYSYRAMPWSRAKALPPPDNALFDACFRIQREAAGHHIPLIVENVRGAQKWVGPAQANFGSFYLWGNVPLPQPALPGFNSARQRLKMSGTAFKSQGMNWSDPTLHGHDFTRIAGRQAMEGMKGIPHRTAGHWTNPAEHEGTKNGNDWFGSGADCSLQRRAASGSSARKAASAMIAKIPEPLARYIAATFYPR